MTPIVRVSILIKALNEQESIETCLEAATREAQSIGGEVILVDSLSTDRTVEIASKFPVRIVQFDNASDCSCGAATQLGYQYALGEYLYLLDGDMELQPGFIALALEYLEANMVVAGVGGLIVDTRIITPADKRRAEHYSSIGAAVFVNHLGGGGLYKREAIVSVDYLANRWLKACEEADLGVRLISAGWQLVRLPVPAVTHTGYNESRLDMICRLWHNGRMTAHGVFLRSSLGHAWWWLTVRNIWFVFAVPLIYCLAATLSWFFVSLGFATLISVLSSVSLLWGLVFLIQWQKKKIATDALLAIVAWHFYTISAAAGFVEKVANPCEIISSREKNK